MPRSGTPAGTFAAAKFSIASGRLIIATKGPALLPSNHQGRRRRISLASMDTTLQEDVPYEDNSEYEDEEGEEYVDEEDLEDGELEGEIEEGKTRF